MRRTYKRRQYIIKKPFQYRFIGWVVGTVLLAGLVLFIDVTISLHLHAVQQGLPVRVPDLYSPTEPVTVLKFIIYLVSVFYASVVLSNRVAGPIYRFEKSAEEVAGGNLTHKVFLRQQDEMLDFRDTFNSMVDSLRSKVAGEAACAFRAKAQLESMLEDPSVPVEVVERVKRVINEMDRVGKGFRI